MTVRKYYQKVNYMNFAKKNNKLIHGTNRETF